MGRNVGRGDLGRVAAGPDAGQTDDAARPDGLDRIGDDLPDTRAFDDDVRLESDIRDAACVVRRPEVAHECRRAPMRRGRGRECPAHAACQRGRRRPIGPAPSRAPSAAPRSRAGRPRRSAPRFRDHRRGFEQHAEETEGGIDLHGVLGLDPPAFGHEAVELLDPRSVYWPLQHMSHSPTAQLEQGTGSGRRTMPTTRSPSLSPPVGPGSTTRPRDSWPRTRRVLPRGAQP